MMVLVSNIRDHLSWIGPMAQEVIERDSTDWTLEDLVANCDSGQWLLMIDDDGSGFTVFSIVETHYKHERLMRVELCCHRNTARTMPDYYPIMDQFARNMRCSRIIMDSKRKGWERAGWAVDWITYSRPVTEVSDVEL